MASIGRYETYEQVGAGAMGVVYRARDKVLDRFVALKVLQTGPDLDREARERFYREAMFGARLQHPNIAVVYDLGEVDNTPFIAMELLRGADLRKYIAEKRLLPLEQKLDLVAQVCDGIAHAHREGIIHRDIKPSNIFIHEERQAKVLDFGIARLPSSTLTVVGNILGTPNYMAPEQILSRPCDTRSDLFSAAIVFYEFLAYVHPFRATFIPRRIVDGVPDSLYDRQSNIPPALEELIQKALAKAPADRIQTAEELGMGFRRILKMMRTGLPAHEISVTQSPWGNGSHVPPPLLAAEPDDDSRGRRVAESVTLDRELDRALDAGNLADAEATLKQLAKLASVDPELSSLLNEREEQVTRASQGVSIAMEQAAPEKAMSAAAGAGEEYSFDLIAAPQAVETGSMTALLNEEKILDGGTSSPSLPMESQTDDRAGSQTGTRSSHRLWILAATGVIAIAALLTFVFAGRPSPPVVERQAGEASIGNLKVDVRENPSDASKPVDFLQAGMRVNLVEKLTALDQQWIRVQSVPSNGSNVGHAGFVHVAQLSSCSSRQDAQTAWNCLLLAAPEVGAGEQRVDQFAARLEEIGRQFPALIGKAAVERATRYVRLARLAKEGGKTAADRAGWLAKAATSLDSAGTAAAGSDDVRKLRGGIEALQADPEPPPVTVEPVMPPNQEVQAILARIRVKWDSGDGDYDTCINLADQALGMDSQNAAAKSWKRKCQNASRLDPKTN